MKADVCATLVYAECGKNFATELTKYSGYNAAYLCDVFIQEGGCIYSAAKTRSCQNSPILKRFKENSDAAAGVVLSAICPSNDIREELSNKKRQDKLFSLKEYLESKRDNPVNQ